MSMEGAPRPSVADLNDAFRKICAPYVTPGVMLIPDVASLIQAVRDFDDFTPDNDPYGEHDFGALDWHQDRVFWKIDYYDKSMMYGSEYPADPDVTEHALTIMLAEEY